MCVFSWNVFWWGMMRKNSAYFMGRSKWSPIYTNQKYVYRDQITEWPILRRVISVMIICFSKRRFQEKYLHRDLQVCMYNARDCQFNLKLIIITSIPLRHHGICMLMMIISHLEINEIKVSYYRQLLCSIFRQIDV